MNTVLFDLDGTLLPMDTEQFMKLYFGNLVAYFPNFDSGELKNAVVAGTEAMFRNDGSLTNREAFAKKFNELMGKDYFEYEPQFLKFYATDFAKCKSACKENHGSKELVDMLRAKGYKIGIATNPMFPKEATRMRLSWIDLDWRDFPVVTTFEESRYTKPNPEYYKSVCRDIGSEPSECIMVGNDVREDGAAAKAGIEVLFVTDCIIECDESPMPDSKRMTFSELLEWANALPEVG